MSNPIVTIEMENGGAIKAELYPGRRAHYRQELRRLGAKGLLRLA